MDPLDKQNWDSVILGFFKVSLVMVLVIFALLFVVSWLIGG